MKNLRINFNINFIIVLIIVLILFPFIIHGRYARHILILSMLYAVVASNWDLTFGYFGIFNFSHLAIFILGGYIAGILSKSYGVSPFICIIIASLFSAIIASIISLPMLRVKGIYVCLVTYGFSNILYRFVLYQKTLTGGSSGLTLIPDINFGNYYFAQNDRIAFYFLSLFLLIISTLFLNKIVKSSFGLGILALRDFEEYAVSRGVNFGSLLVFSFIASSLFTGAAGAIMAFYLTSLSPALFGMNMLITVLTMIIVGGSSTIYGPIIGSFIVTVLSEYLIRIGPWRFIIIGSLVIFIMRFYSNGIWPIILNFLNKFKMLINSNKLKY